MNARTQLRILAGIFATWSPKTKIITERDYEINGCLAHRSLSNIRRTSVISADGLLAHETDLKCHRVYVT